MTKLLFLMLTFTSLIIGCIHKEKPNSTTNVTEKYFIPVDSTYNKKSIALNDSAIELTKYITRNRSTNDSLKLLTAVSLLDKAIELDSNYYLAYINKVTLLSKLNEYESALVLLEKASNIRPYDDQAVLLQGIIYEKLNDLESAQKKYKQAIELIRNKTAQNEYDSVMNKMSIAFVTLLMSGKEQALKIVDSVKYRDNPKLKSIIENTKTTIDLFDRGEFLDSY